ncbi:hypothetical protein [Chryseobacterium sp. 6424]|uniref:hypothetical protein n=1 Tax=Chryseobacterium sp. 6424 TaxID=2039166 RepID=UPI001E591A15|nr:hypothetical protein [Chryseobacterium sp. 6424]
MELDLIKVKYIDIVYRVLMRWYAEFAENTLNILVGILVFVLILKMSRFLSKNAVRLFS